MAGNAPPPPPNIPNGQTDEETVRSLIEWVWAFYRSVILENFLATSASLSSLEDIVDPASATAASAQETANTALTLATANDVRLDAIKAGSVTISDTDTSADLTFAAAFEDNSYFVTASPSAKTGSPAAGSQSIDAFTKTDARVTVTVQAAPGAGNSVTYDVIAIRL